jgi:hypothetical protein
MTLTVRFRLQNAEIVSRLPQAPYSGLGDSVAVRWSQKIGLHPTMPSHTLN